MNIYEFKATTEQMAAALCLTTVRCNQLAVEGVLFKSGVSSFLFFESLVSYHSKVNKKQEPKEKDAAQIANLNAKTALNNIEIAKLEKELVPIADVITSFVAVIKPVSDLLSDLPDIIERKTGAAPDVVNAVSREIDAHRLVMFEKLDAVLNGNLYEASVTVDDGLDDGDKPAKKPRKVKNA